MKTMIFVSLASFMPTTLLEYTALSRSLAAFGHGFSWSLSDHAAMAQRATMPEVIQAISPAIREDQLLETFLTHFHTLLDEYRAAPDGEVLDVLGLARREGRRCLLLSDYPLQTTNLARAAGLQSRATGVGEVVALRHAERPSTVDARLHSLIEAEGLVAADCTAIVARGHDARMAARLGLSVRMIEADARSLTERPSAPASKAESTAPIAMGLAALPDHVRRPVAAHSVAA